MRRAIAAVVTTVAGLVLLLSFKSHAGESATSVVATAPQTPGATASPTPSASESPTPTPTTTRKSTKAATYTGDTFDTRYGPVQVTVTVTGGKLTDVSAVQLPQADRRDIEINNFAVPQLRQEALDAQSANIDSISGATFTSDGYIQSLQSALDQAGLG
jgi:uncharacterized protein with FMN-binding domain